MARATFALLIAVLASASAAQNSAKVWRQMQKRVDKALAGKFQAARGRALEKGECVDMCSEKLECVMGFEHAFSEDSPDKIFGELPTLCGCFKKAQKCLASLKCDEASSLKNVLEEITASSMCSRRCVKQFKKMHANGKCSYESFPQWIEGQDEDCACGDDFEPMFMTHSDEFCSQSGATACVKDTISTMKALIKNDCIPCEGDEGEGAKRLLGAGGYAKTYTPTPTPSDWSDDDDNYSCDIDQDGLDALACGGTDCDDTDSAVGVCEDATTEGTDAAATTEGADAPAATTEGADAGSGGYGPKYPNPIAPGGAMGGYAKTYTPSPTPSDSGTSGGYGPTYPNPIAPGGAMGGYGKTYTPSPTPSDSGTSGGYEVEESDPMNCEYNNQVPATCWADSAFHECADNRQGAYDDVLSASPDQEAMYQLRLTCGYGKKFGSKPTPSGTGSGTGGSDGEYPDCIAACVREQADDISCEKIGMCRTEKCDDKTAQLIKWFVESGCEEDEGEEEEEMCCDEDDDEEPSCDMQKDMQQGMLEGLDHLAMMVDMTCDGYLCDQLASEAPDCDGLKKRKKKNKCEGRRRAFFEKGKGVKGKKSKKLHKKCRTQGYFNGYMA